MKDNKLIITINREFGSGGREISYKLGALLDIKVYDKQALEEIEENLGVANELPEKIYDIQKDILLNIASKESCIIVGRTGFHIFRNHPNVVRVLLIADYDARVKHVSEKHGITKMNARKRIDNVDRAREEYTKKYTGVSRYDARNYDLVINVSNVTSDEVAKFIAENIRKRYPNL